MPQTTGGQDQEAERENQYPRDDGQQQRDRVEYDAGDRERLFGRFKERDDAEHQAREMEHRADHEGKQKESAVKALFKVRTVLRYEARGEHQHANG